MHARPTGPAPLCARWGAAGVPGGGGGFPGAARRVGADARPPDGARPRLRSRGPGPPVAFGDDGPRRHAPGRPGVPAGAAGSGWGGPEAVEVEPDGANPEPVRVGWPSAPPGTPAARLRLQVGQTSSSPDLPDSSRGRDAWWDDDGEEARPARSAWDPPRRGDRARRWAARWLPASWVGARWDPGRVGALALAAVAALAAVV